VVAFEVEIASRTVPSATDPTFVRYRRATRSRTPALAPVSWNFTGTVLPSLKTELPSRFTGCRTFDHAAVTRTVNDPVPVLPAWSSAVHVTVVLPSGNTLPDALSQVATTVPSTTSVAVGAA
jgi:hypothetical protein